MCLLRLVVACLFVFACVWGCGLFALFGCCARLVSGIVYGLLHEWLLR